MKDEESPCPMHRNEENNKNRYNPRNVRVALSFQLHDHLRMLYGLAYAPDAKGFNQTLDMIDASIRFYREHHIRETA